MSVFIRSLGLALVLAALCLGGRTAHAQAAAVPYWMPNGLVGFGGNLGVDQNGDASGGASRYNFPNGWFIGGGRGGMGFGMTGINQAVAFGNPGSLYYEGMKFGYDFKNSPLTIYGGVHTKKNNVGSRPHSPVPAFQIPTAHTPCLSLH